MKPLDYPDIASDLAEAFRRLPGIGPRSAERMMLWALQNGKKDAVKLAEALASAFSSLSQCPVCGFFAESGICPACSDLSRDTTMICVVEHPSDVLPIERCGQFKGLYHCLGGTLSPLDRINPEDLRINGLLERVNAITQSSSAAPEVILALGSHVNGEATCSYLSSLLAPAGCKISRIAQGLPAGSGLDHADPLTLMRALSGRVPMQG